MSEETKTKVLREGFDSLNSDQQEICIMLMADLIDLNRMGEPDIRIIDNGMNIVKCLRPAKRDDDPIEVQNMHMAALKVLSFMESANCNWTQEMSEEI